MQKFKNYLKTDFQNMIQNVWSNSSLDRKSTLIDKTLKLKFHELK